MSEYAWEERVNKLEAELEALRASHRWVVIVGKGSWATCYGGFQSHDEAIAWAKQNQFDADNRQIHPVMKPGEDL